MARPLHRTPEYEPLLPDLCSGPRILAIVVIAELLAIVLTLAPSGVQVARWRDLGLISLFVQWVGLSCAGLLCLLRPWLGRLSRLGAALLSLLLLLAVTLLLSEATFRIAQGAGLAGTLPDDWHVELLLRNMVVAAVVGGLTLRYFFVQQQWRETVRAEMEARVQALQARIRPHFLFNSLNTIASLVRTQPEVAEQAVEALAELFRASLTQTRLISLEDELALAQRYLDIERLRLSERLEVRWDMDGVPRDAPIPALTLQPLVENAVYHGIEPRPQGGVIDISGRLTPGGIEIEIRNPVCESGHRAQRGHRIAQESVRQRLAACYGGGGRLQIVPGEGSYRVRLTLPYPQQRREAAPRCGPV